MYFVEDLAQMLMNTIKWVSTRFFFFSCNRGQDNTLTFSCVSHILTVLNYQVYSDDEFGRWHVYSGERPRAS